MVDACRLHRLGRPLPLEHLELLGRLDLRLRGDALNFAVILRFVHLFVLRVVALKCAIEREFVHEHISEHVDFFALRLDVRSIAHKIQNKNGLCKALWKWLLKNPKLGFFPNFKR